MFEHYEIIEHRKIADLNSDGYILRHEKTKAYVTLLLNDDENKVFYIGFRTPPSDSTGVAHILEHSVLCGSEKFPIKDPFIELAKGSLNTFLNAMTYPDKTVYPVASCNDQDFHNLMDVYLDAVFHPNIYKEEKIFRQEGHHYELTDKDGELTLNGVVYNEMKGAFSSPDDVVEREVMNSLYPDVTYGLESGGDPDVIPELTYEEFLDFHKKFYHPSNSYIYLYGNLDAEETLRFIDEEYLSHYDYLEVDSSIGFQKPFDEPKRLVKEYPVLDEESSEGTYLTYNLCIGNALDKKLAIALDILDYVLLSAPGAVIRQALLDEGIGDDVYSSVESGIYQPFFGITAKNADPEDEDRFVSIIEEKIREVIENGLPKKALKAAINIFEFKYRESDFGSYPRGLMLGLGALTSWLYDKEAPFLHIEANETYAFMHENIDTGYFEGLLQKYFLDNSHRSILKVVPKAGLTSEKEEALKKKLAEYKASLSEEEIEKLIRDTEKLKAYQTAPDDPKDIKKIPLLSRKDLKTEGYKPVNEVHEEDGTVIVHHELFTNGIIYLELNFDIGALPKEMLPHVGLLNSVIGLVDTEHYGYNDLYNEINIATGGMTWAYRTVPDIRDKGTLHSHFYVKMKVLKEHVDEALALVREVFMLSKYGDHKRLHEILNETRVRIQASMVSGGHQTASQRALSYFDKQFATDDTVSGLSFYRYLCDLTDRFEEEKDRITEALDRVSSAIFRPENLIVSVTCDSECYEGIPQKITDFKKGLYQDAFEKGRVSFDLTKKNEGFKTAGQVQFVCRAGRFEDKGLPYTGALRVLKTILSYDYLWNNVRVLGGAYGCMCAFSRSGIAFFVSYRDPKLEETIGIYENAADYIRTLDLDERKVTQYIIGALSELDVPQTPSVRGSFSFIAYLTHSTDEVFQQERDELLSVDEETIRGLYRYIEAFMKDDVLCVVGNADMVEEKKDLFGSVSQLV